MGLVFFVKANEHRRQSSRGYNQGSKEFPEALRPAAETATLHNASFNYMHTKQNLTFALNHVKFLCHVSSGQARHSHNACDIKDISITACDQGILTLILSTDMQGEFS